MPARYEGRIVDFVTGEPLTGVELIFQINGSEYTEVTDLDGNYSLRANTTRVKTTSYSYQVKINRDPPKNTQLQNYQFMNAYVRANGATRVYKGNFTLYYSGMLMPRLTHPISWDSLIVKSGLVNYTLKDTMHLGPLLFPPGEKTISINFFQNGESQKDWDTSLYIPNKRWDSDEFHDTAQYYFEVPQF